ncbi:MAG TPA: SDR family NAD(P)-dependent oxidoreductase [Natronosporangium sp.]
MSGTIAVFGAGPALGMAVARRFGRAGYRVALVARNRAKLDGYVRELAGLGIEAAAFPADLADRAAAVKVLGEIDAEFGPVEVLEYSPGPLEVRVVPARELDVSDVEPMLDLRFRTPVALARAALPGMVERGRGGLLFAFGSQPRQPDPSLGNVGIAQAALLHHVHNLHASLATDGVYAGALLIAGLIEGSEVQQLLRTGGADHLPDEVELDLPVLDPDRLADRFWEMYTTDRGVAEVMV